jgi:sodium transport system permease protein
MNRAGSIMRRLRLNNVMVIVRKELVDHFRDRRSLVMGLLYPLLGPLLLSGSLYVAGNVTGVGQQAKAIAIPTIGVEHAPVFVEYLSENGIDLVAMEGDVAGFVKSGGAPLGFEIPAEAAVNDQFNLKVYADFSKIDNLRASSYVSQVIARFNRSQAVTLAQEAGIREDFMITVAIDQINLSRPADMAVFLYNLMPPLIMFMIFLAGVHITVDMTAGERERGSLEPLLITPIERSGLLFGKATVGLIMTMLTMLMNLGGFLLFLGLSVGLHGDMTPPPPLASFAMMFLVALPLMALAVSLQVAIALVSRSMKEAQIYLGLLPLVPALPGMVLIFSPLNPSDAVAATPLLGQLTLFNQLVAGESINPSHFAMSAAVSLVLAIIVFMFARSRFEKERLLFAT